MENRKSDLVLATLTVCAFACVGLGIVGYLPRHMITGAFVDLLGTFETTGHVALFALAGALTIGLAGGLIFFGH